MRPPAQRRGWRWAGALLLATSVAAGVACPARAGDSRTEFVPEVDAYVKLGERTRLFLFGALNQGLSDGATDGTVGVHLDVTLMPIFRPRLREADWERERYLWVRLGYVLAGSLDEPDNTPLEHRMVFEATGRAALPFEVWLVTRERVELRDIGGEVSARFRSRLRLEREVTVGGVTLVPYAQAEVFYDTRFGAWNRQRYQAGAEIEITGSWRIEPYYARQEDQRSSLAHVDQIGLVLKYYR